MTLNEEPFICTQCGECCKGYGGTYLTRTDLRAIADFLGISEQEFLQRYCSLSGRRPILGQRSDGYCVFFKHNCSIHPVKPRMCRNWPYIESLLIDIRNWHVMANSCPGMRQDLDDQSLLETARAKLEAHARDPQNEEQQRKHSRDGNRRF